MNLSKSTYRLNLPIGELFKFLNVDGDWFDAVQLVERNVNILDPHGKFVPIIGYVKKIGPVRTYSLENNVTIACDENHLIKQSDKTFKLIKNANHVIIDNEPVTITGNTKPEIKHVYDIVLNDPHEYITSSGIVCHNTSAAKVIAAALDADTMYINASDENSVETVRDRIKTFASSVGFKQWKIIILDEFSYFSLNAQSALNSMMEAFSKRTRFIITCNYIEKVLPSIRSRCTCFHLDSPAKPIMAKRLQYILTEEKIEHDIKDLVTIVNKYYPDQRTILNQLQRASITGKLIIPTESAYEENYLGLILKEMTSKSNQKECYTNVRQIIADSKVKMFDDLFRFLFDNIATLAPKNQAEVILIIAKYAQTDPMVLDKEINATAMIIEILTVIK